MAVMSASARDQRPRQAILGQLPRINRDDGSPDPGFAGGRRAGADQPGQDGVALRGLDRRGRPQRSGSASASSTRSNPTCSSWTSCFPTSMVCRSCSGSANPRPYTPTLFLTARDSVMDRVTGLTAGADDYMTKPFSLEELVARLRGLLRRSSHLAPPAEEALTVGDLTLDGASHEVARAGTPISLSSTEFELLRFLMRNPRRALTRTEILDRVWNYDFAGRTSIVDLYISYLRKKIDAGREPMIHTVRGVGYMLRAAGMTPRWQRNDQGRNHSVVAPTHIAPSIGAGRLGGGHGCGAGGRHRLRGQPANLCQHTQRRGSRRITGRAGPFAHQIPTWRIAATTAISEHGDVGASPDRTRATSSP